MTKEDALKTGRCENCAAWSVKKNRCSSLAEDCPRTKGKGGE
jgi:hypothetical protein